MLRLHRVAMLACALPLALAATPQTASAQRAGFIRLFRPYHHVALAQLPEVQDELKLNDDQKQRAVDLNDDLNAERGALWQEAAGDFESIREDMELLNNDIEDEFAESLDDEQKRRLAEIYIQANGPTALFNSRVAESLELTDEQQEKISDVRTETFGEFRDVDWQSLSEEESNKKVEELIAGQNEKYAAVMTDEQKAEFEKLQGTKLELDLANLPNPFGG